MNYRILRNESRIGRKGNDETFLHIEVNTGTEVFTKAKWLSPAEIVRVKADSAAIDNIAQAMAERAVIARPALKIQEDRAREIHLERVKLETAKTALNAETKRLEAAQAEILLKTAKL